MTSNGSLGSWAIADRVSMISPALLPHEVSRRVGSGATPRVSGGMMDRMRAPTEFGFTTGPYIPPERTRPLWRSLFFGALLALIPIVGPGISAVYVDRREI